MRAIALGLIGALTTPAVGDPLPKGDVKAVDQNKIKGPAAPVEMMTSCFDDFGYPLGENGYFTSDSGTLFLLTTAGLLKRKGKNDASTQGAPLMRYVLQRVDLVAKKINTDLGLSHKEGAHLITFGEPVKGIQAIAFDSPEKDCLTGPAGLIGVSFKAGASAVRETGKYTLVPGRKGSVLVDNDKGRLTETDLETFQRRYLAKIPSNERPLYYDSGQNILVSFRQTPKNRGLVRYKVFVTSLEEERKLSIGQRDRVLRDGELFGFLATDVTKNQAMIRQVPVWTGKDKMRRSTFILPPSAKVQDALYIADFERERVAVVGKNENVKRKWGSVFLYDLKTSKLGHQMRAGKGLYYRFTGFAPNGSVFVAEAINSAGITRAIHVYDFATSKQIEYDVR